MTPRPRRRPGWLLVAIIFLVGGAFLAGLFLTARSNISPEYRDATPGLPLQPLRIASLDLNWQPLNLPNLLKTFEGTAPDFILLQGLSRRDAQAIADALEMRNGGQLQMAYSPANSADPSRPGNAILARHPLYHGRAMKRRKSDSVGLIAEAVIAGRRFMLVSIDLDQRWTAPASPDVRDELWGLRESWTDAGEPPLIAGGDWSTALGADGAFTIQPGFPATLHPPHGFAYSSQWPHPIVKPLAPGLLLLETRPD